MSDKKVPKIKFNNGQEFPLFGLGTWKSEPGKVTDAVKHAIDVGYRHIDCAHIYLNEKEVGDAVRAKIEEGIVKREDLYITSKLWNTFHKPDLVEGALRETLKNLQIDQLDLYLIHWPVGFQEGDNLFPLDSNGKVFKSQYNYVDTWKSMEEMVRKGLTKSIGISNFNKRQIDSILAIATILPVTNQIEVHPYLNQMKLIDYCKSQNIVVTAYSPLGSPDRPWAKPDEPNLMNDPKLLVVANKYGKTVAQILLRYSTQRGLITIPKSVTNSRIEQNFDIFDFELTSDDMSYIDTFNCNERYCPMFEAYGHPDHPFENDEY